MVVGDDEWTMGCSDVECMAKGEREVEVIGRSSLSMEDNMDMPILDVVRCRKGEERSDVSVDNVSSRLVSSALGMKGLTKDKGVVDLHMKIAEMSIGLTKPQRDELAMVFNRIGSLLPPDLCGRLHLPTDAQLMRSCYHEGKKAIIPNIPRPSAKRVGQHTYLSPIVCVADLLAHGVDLDVIAEEVVRCLGECRDAVVWRQGLHGNMDGRGLHLWLAEWLDDFDPNTSSKANRRSVWIKTVTISSPAKMVNRGMNTYVVSVGPKKSSHEEVERMFRKDLVRLSSGVDLYWKGKGMTRVTARLLVSLQDQPERRSANYLLGGNSR